MAKPGKPSLIDTSPSPDGATGAEEHSIRMLDALESGTRSTPGSAARRSFKGVLVALLVLVAGGAAWSWWGQGSRVDDRNERIAQVGGPVTPEVGKASSVAASAAAAASSASEPAPGATIIAMPESTPASAAAVAPAAVVAAASAPAASASSSTSIAAPAAAPSAASATRQAAAKPAKAKQSPSTSSRDARVAASSNPERKRTTATAAPSNDPDVALLSAMLATMSGEARANANASPNAQTQLTIAQLVQRCNTQGVKNAIETFECKRRICEGYWGKADACPMSLSPKKN